MWPILVLADWRAFLAVILICGAIGAFRHRAAQRRSGQVARENADIARGFGPRATEVPQRWRDHAIFGEISREIVIGMLEGTHGGRPFAAFLLRYELPFRIFRGFSVDLTSVLGPALFTAVVVEAELPDEFRALDQRRALQPWHSAFGPDSSVAWRPGLASSDEIHATLGQLSDGIDELVASPRWRN